MPEAGTARTPVDRVIGGYFLVTAAAMLFPDRPGGWVVLLLLHLSVAAVLLSGGLDRIRRRATRGPDRSGLDPRDVLLDWYPLLLFPFLYWELPLLSGAIWDGHYFDALILRWEETVFGGLPSTWLAARFDSILLSELLHGAYLSYYPVLYSVPFILYIRRQHAAFGAAVFALILGLLAHYVVYVGFPVQGPRYLFPPPAGDLAGGPLYRLTHILLESGSSQGAAFPSSHAAIAALQTVNAVRFLPSAVPLLALVTIGISVGAVYGGFHYAIDMVLGLATGVILGVAAHPIYRRLS